MCDYVGREFGATYDDSLCIDGQLWDADKCDDKGNLYEPFTYIPCPACNERWLEEMTCDEEVYDSMQEAMAVWDSIVDYGKARAKYDFSVALKKYGRVKLLYTSPTDKFKCLEFWYTPAGTWEPQGDHK